MSQTAPSAPNCAESPDEVVAAHVSRPVSLDAAHPANEWRLATPVSFCANWAGKKDDPARQTTVRVLWSAEMLYLRFECKYRDITVFSDSDTNGRRDHLWDRDVVEVFLQPDASKARYYKEFWEDIVGIAPGQFIETLLLSHVARVGTPRTPCSPIRTVSNRLRRTMTSARLRSMIGCAILRMSRVGRSLGRSR